MDVDAQRIMDTGNENRGGYSARYGGATPWATPRAEEYLLGRLRSLPHVVTDSACSATSMTSGIKTYNAAINVNPSGEQVVPIARELQQRGWGIGVVTSVPISHATPAAAYANNVSRNDYQDLTRDLIGLPSVAHRDEPLPGVDVLLGCGWGEESQEPGGQGNNFIPGNVYIAQEDLEAIDVRNGGKYEVVQRTAGQPGRDLLLSAVAMPIRTEPACLVSLESRAGKAANRAICPTRRRMAASIRPRRNTTRRMSRRTRRWPTWHRRRSECYRRTRKASG